MNKRIYFYAIYLLPVTVVAGAIIALDHAGIDPLVSGWFFDAQSGKTFAELVNEEKLARSHRGRALWAMFDWFLSHPQ